MRNTFVLISSQAWKLNASIISQSASHPEGKVRMHTRVLSWRYAARNLPFFHHGWHLTWTWLGADLVSNAFISFYILHWVNYSAIYYLALASFHMGGGTVFWWVAHCWKKEPFRAEKSLSTFPHVSFKAGGRCLWLLHKGWFRSKIMAAK